MEECIVFVNRLGECITIEGYFEDWESAELEVNSEDVLDKSLLEKDGWGITTYVDMKKAFQPLKFYRIGWCDTDLDTPDGHIYSTVLTSYAEIDYLGEQKANVKN